MDQEKPMIQPHQFLNTIPRFENALCAELEDQDLFFPDGKAEEAKRLPQLRAICRGCVERKECLEYSIEKRSHTASGVAKRQPKEVSFSRDQKSSREKSAF